MTTNKLTKLIAEYSDVVAQNGSTVLRDFSAHSDALGINERVAKEGEKSIGRAHYRSYDLKGNFAGDIVYRPEVVDDLEDWASFRSHEFIHGSQHHFTPALYMHPRNGRTTFWLSPVDFVLANMACELEAYSKQGWLTNEFMSAAGNPVSALSPDKLLPHQTLAAAMNNFLASYGDDLRKALAHMAATFYLEQQMQSFTPSEGMVPFSYNYQKQGAMNYILATNGAIRRFGPEILNRVEFVRMEDQDIIDMTSTFGPSPLVNGKGELISIYGEESLHPEITEGLAKFAQDFGVARREDLPTISEAMAARGLTPQDAIDRSRGGSPDRSQGRSLRPR